MAEDYLYKSTGEQESDFSALPAGDYVCSIKNAEIKETKSKTGRYLSLTWEVLQGQYKNRLIFENLNLWHDNTQAREIAQKAMNSICMAIGKPEGIRDRAELYGKPMELKLSVKSDPQYGDSNQIKKHSSYGGNGIQQSAPQATTAGKKPWEK